METTQSKSCQFAWYKTFHIHDLVLNCQIKLYNDQTHLTTWRGVAMCCLILLNLLMATDSIVSSKCASAWSLSHKTSMATGITSTILKGLLIRYWKSKHNKCVWVHACSTNTYTWQLQGGYFMLIVVIESTLKHLTVQVRKSDRMSVGSLLH